MITSNLALKTIFNKNIQTILHLPIFQLPSILGKYKNPQSLIPLTFYGDSLILSVLSVTYRVTCFLLILSSLLTKYFSTNWIEMIRINFYFGNCSTMNSFRNDSKDVERTMFILELKMFAILKILCFQLSTQEISPILEHFKCSESFSKSKCII